ncbi:uncharacterized protein LOC106174187 isoform X2 [Lingula anatina]|uniref:Uncharacterized protein LOC106174187 isoform X2 n=1 Tax=Lingula anatina TaxID=7574 RepID=A0A1S3JME0_LINAN|nr:uncharacterized protein LOC106174187 isoform X2 [Lingula anatina]|eukprot:XP_013411074.1 uncharacterized protein LOC106174187 isoform X2 [Lingula anatina]
MSTSQLGSHNEGWPWIYRTASSVHTHRTPRNSEIFRPVKFDSASSACHPLLISRNLSVTKHLLVPEKPDVRSKNYEKDSVSQKKQEGSNVKDSETISDAKANKSVSDFNIAEGGKGKSISPKSDSGAIEGENGKSLSKKSSEGDAEGDDEKSLTLFQRFKKVYKTHGKVFIVVEVTTSIGWFGLFYGIAKAGLDIVPLLEYFNASESIMKHFRPGSNLGDIALAFIMYKLVAPVRYMVTIVGTQQAIKYLRRKERIPKMEDQDRLRAMLKEGREEFRENFHEIQEQFKHYRENRKLGLKKDRQKSLINMRTRLTNLLHERRQKRLELAEAEKAKHDGKEDEEHEAEKLMEEIKREEEMLEDGPHEQADDSTCKDLEPQGSDEQLQGADLDTKSEEQVSRDSHIKRNS